MTVHSFPPRNQLGEVATKTPRETLTRLREKAARNHGGANRQRIRVRIAARVRHAAATSLLLTRARPRRERRPRRVTRRGGLSILWVVPVTAVLLAPVVWAISTRSARAAR